MDTAHKVGVRATSRVPLPAEAQNMTAHTLVMLEDFLEHKCALFRQEEENKVAFQESEVCTAGWSPSHYTILIMTRPPPDPP